MKKKLTDEQRQILKQALWDLNLTPEEFLAIIEGKITRKWPERGFCVARMLESINWFDVIKVVKPRLICNLWDISKKYIRIISIKEGMNFAYRILREDSISDSGKSL